MRKLPKQNPGLVLECVGPLPMGKKSVESAEVVFLHKKLKDIPKKFMNINRWYCNPPMSFIYDLR